MVIEAPPGGFWMTTTVEIGPGGAVEQGRPTGTSSSSAAAAEVTTEMSFGRHPHRSIRMAESASIGPSEASISQLAGCSTILTMQLVSFQPGLGGEERAGVRLAWEGLWNMVVRKLGDEERRIEKERSMSTVEEGKAVVDHEDMMLD